MDLDLETVGDILDELAEDFPPELFEGLNGGISLLEGEVPDPDFPPGEMYILGEYVDGVLGRYINIYYGSFLALARLERWTKETWEEELYETLSHELTHHMEARSGTHALDDRDAAEMEKAYRKLEEEK